MTVFKDKVATERLNSILSKLPFTIEGHVDKVYRDNYYTTSPLPIQYWGIRIRCMINEEYFNWLGNEDQEPSYDTLKYRVAEFWNILIEELLK